MNHGSYFWYAHNESLLAPDNANIVRLSFLSVWPCSLVAVQHVGIRGALNDWADYENDYDVGFVISHAEDLEDIGWKGVVKMIRDTVGSNPVYSAFGLFRLVL